MSLFLQHGTCMNDAQVLKKILRTRFQGVEMHATPQNLYGYHGDKREQTAEIIVRREFIGSASNDIGFKRNAQSGNFDAIISQYDSHKHNDKWLENVGRDYLIEKAKALMTEQESELVEQTVTGDGSVRMKFRVNAMA